MKKKRFYDNKKRNQKWTEEEKGRPIDFADKYVYDGAYSDKFDYKRPKSKTKKFSKIKVQKFVKNTIITVLCLCLISVGYTLMDFYMQRVSYKTQGFKEETVSDTSSTISALNTDFKSYYADGVYFDNSTLLESLKTSIKDGGFNSILVDVKRSNGTVAYESSLATVQSYMAVSSAGSNFEGSISNLKSNGITVVARIYCFQDSVVPGLNTSDVIIGDDGEPYIDLDGSTWLNPQSKEAFEYIENIIKEVHSMGIDYFVLDGVNMPDELKNKYKSSFKDLADKLYVDLGYDIKFIEPVQCSVDEKATSTSVLSLKELDQKSNQMLMITSKATDKKLVEKLGESKITNYVILQ